jgi:hypothetical protein
LVIGDNFKQYHRHDPSGERRSGNRRHAKPLAGESLATRVHV